MVKVEEAEAPEPTYAASPGCSGSASAEVESCSAVEASAKVIATLAARTKAGGVRKRLTNGHRDRAGGAGLQSGAQAAGLLRQ